MAPRSSVQGAFALLLLAQAMSVQAQRPAAFEEAARPAAGNEAEGFLSLLEFIGEFTTEDGEWVDPEILLEAELTGAGRRSESGTGDEESESANQIERCADPRCE